MRRKRTTPLNSWETAHKGSESEKHYSRYGDSLLDSPKLCKLNGIARLVYLYMVRAAAGKQEFTFAREFYIKRGFSPPSVNRAIKELIEEGFICRKTSGKLTRTPNIYEFISQWKE